MCRWWAPTEEKEATSSKAKCNNKEQHAFIYVPLSSLSVIFLFIKLLCKLKTYFSNNTL
jgi:hypothetical protein